MDIPEKQKIFAEMIKSENDKILEETGKRRKFCVTTFGCQMNAHDSEKIIYMFERMGFEKTDKEETADVIAYNTCCVRENAENRVYGNLGYLKRLKEDRDFKIILCGCMMQQGSVVERIKKTYAHTDIILGTFNLHRLPELLQASYDGGGQIIDIWEEHGELEDDIPSSREKSFRASVNIMYGCNNFCSYCIVPYVRGRERSREPEDILREIKELASSGVRELMLLGQNVNSYGSDKRASFDFAGLLRLVSQVPGIERIRFMTSHPKDLSDSLIAEMRDNPKLCRHLHLPVQSGSTRILEKMNRKYSAADYLSLTEKLRREIPGIALTTDIIVGFPGETAEDFSETLELVKNVRFSGAYTFIYSIRNGTPAALMDGQIPESVSKERFQRLLGVLNPIIHEETEKINGSAVSVLVENVNDGIATGRADNNTLVHFPSSGDITGSFADVKITACKTFYCTGHAIRRPEDNKIKDNKIKGD